jgi:hypothetical protein
MINSTLIHRLPLIHVCRFLNEFLPSYSILSIRLSMLRYLGPPGHHLHRLYVINGIETAFCRCSNLSVHNFLVLPSLRAFSSTMRSTTRCTRCSALSEDALQVHAERNSPCSGFGTVRSEYIRFPRFPPGICAAFWPLMTLIHFS